MIFSILIAAILFAPTTIWASTEIYLLFLPIFFFKYYREIPTWINSFRENPFSKKHLKTVGIVFLILLLIAGNLAYGGAGIKSFVKSPLLLMPLTFMGAFLIADKTVIRLLLIFIGVECLIGIAEYACGVNTFFTHLPRYFEFVNYDSLYHTRTFGLGWNSSNLAQNVFIGIVLLSTLDLGFKKHHFYTLFTLFVIGVVISFGRTVLIATLILFCVLLLIHFVKMLRGIEIKSFAKNTAVMAAIALVAFIGFSDFFVEQFTRFDLIPRMLDDSDGKELLELFGLGNIEMSGRRELWAKGLEFVITNPLFGNHSIRFVAGESHLHNSFLEYLTTHGIIIFSLMIGYIFLHLKKKNFLIITFICLYSFGQFGIFWNTSFLDVLLMCFLIYYPKRTSYVVAK